MSTDVFSEYNYRQSPDAPPDTSNENDRHELPSFETVDAAMLDWVRGLNIAVETVDGFRAVPILWGDPEKAFQIKSNAELRDGSGTLIYPIIAVDRVSKRKAKDMKGVYWADIPAIRDFYGGTIAVGRKLKPVKSSEFANNLARHTFGVPNYRFSHINMEPWQVEEMKRDPNYKEPADRKGGERPIYTYEYHMVPIPEYFDMMYEISIVTNKMHHMNSIETPIETFRQMNHGHYFTIRKGRWDFEAFLGEDFPITKTGNQQSEEERKFVGKISVRVLGYVIGNEVNKTGQNIIKREGATQIKIGADLEWDGETE
jgi:hypothetical protein